MPPHRIALFFGLFVGVAAGLLLVFAVATPSEDGQRALASDPEGTPTATPDLESPIVRAPVTEGAIDELRRAIREFVDETVEELRKTAEALRPAPGEADPPGAQSPEQSEEAGTPRSDTLQEPQNSSQPNCTTERVEDAGVTLTSVHCEHRVVTGDESSGSVHISSSSTSSVSSRSESR